MSVHAISAYISPVRDLILKKKYSDRLASRQLGQLLCEKTIILEKSFDLLIPVPLHWTRYARRGFNQAEEMACVLGKRMGVPVKNLVARKKRTVYQSLLSHDERQKNVEAIFKIKRRYKDIFDMMVYDKNILLVDDLCTTGATLKNVAQPILIARPRSITAVVASRVV